MLTRQVNCVQWKEHTKLQQSRNQLGINTINNHNSDFRSKGWKQNGSILLGIWVWASFVAKTNILVCVVGYYVPTWFRCNALVII